MVWQRLRNRALPWRALLSMMTMGVAPVLSNLATNTVQEAMRPYAILVWVMLAGMVPAFLFMDSKVAALEPEAGGTPRQDVSDRDRPRLPSGAPATEFTRVLTLLARLLLAWVTLIFTILSLIVFIVGLLASSIVPDQLLPLFAQNFDEALESGVGSVYARLIGVVLMALAWLMITGLYRIRLSANSRLIGASR